MRSFLKAKRAKLSKIIHIGFMPAMLDIVAAESESHIYCVPSDETRVNEVIAPVIGSRGKAYLIGQSWPPDPLLHPAEATLHHARLPTTWDELQQFVKTVHEGDQLATNVMLTGLHRTTDPLKPFTVVEVYPHARGLYTAIDQAKAWARERNATARAGDAARDATVGRRAHSRS